MQLKCVVLGSFKFKNEIDQTIEEFKDLGVAVLAPEAGGLYKSEYSGFYPLASERNQFPADVEEQFISSIRQSDFAYLIAENGYVGTTVSMEIGFCLGYLVPIFSKYPIPECLSYIYIASAAEAVKKQSPVEGKILIPDDLQRIIFSRR